MGHIDPKLDKTGVARKLARRVRKHILPTPTRYGFETLDLSSDCFFSLTV